MKRLLNLLALLSILALANSSRRQLLKYNDPLAKVGQRVFAQDKAGEITEGGRGCCKITFDDGTESTKSPGLTEGWVRFAAERPGSTEETVSVWALIE